MAVHSPQPVDALLPPELLRQWLSPEWQQLSHALQQAGQDWRFIGGCVRDALLQQADASTELDIATTAPPPVTLACIEAVGFRALPTGVAHGTITARAPSGQQWEITSLRQDIETDGRHATVRFGTDWLADAQRRDFTLNSLSADARGRIYDPTGQGLTDLMQGEVRFVGDAAQRIREDTLRLLRYARFWVRFSHHTPDAELQQIFRAHAADIHTLSGERIQQEMTRLLAHPRAALALRWMQHCRWHAPLHLPEPLPLTQLWHLQQRLLPNLPASAVFWADWRLTLACLLWHTPNHLSVINPHWRLSRDDTQHLQRLLTLASQWTALPATAELPALLYQQRKYPQPHRLLQQALILWRVWHRSSPMAEDISDLSARLSQLSATPVPRFPVNGHQLMQALGLPPGTALGKQHQALETYWLQQHCQPDAETLLRLAREGAP